MLTRIRIETFNVDQVDVERELDDFELVLLRRELELVGAVPEGADLEDTLDDLGWPTGMAPGPEVPAGPSRQIRAAVALFHRLGEGAVTRKLQEQVVRESDDGDGWVARRVVRYDGGVYSGGVPLDGPRADDELARVRP